MSINEEGKRLSMKNGCEMMEDTCKTRFCIHLYSNKECL